MRKRRNRSARDKRASNGLCVDCGTVARVSGSLRCGDCHERARTKAAVARQRYLSGRSCFACGMPRFASRLCESCWYKRQSSNACGTIRNWRALKEKLESQEFECWYTGKSLTPGVNASLDHTIPKAKGGTNDLENLRWVDLRVNSMKCSMLESEFLDVCSAVAKRRDSSCQPGECCPP